VVARALSRLADSLPVMPGEQDRCFTNQRRADALVALASARIAMDADPGRASIVVHANVDAAGRLDGGFEIEGGPVIPEHTAQRLLCTSRVQAVIERGAGDVVALGRMAREPSEWMLRQLRHRE
jgi:hypothetical protein